MTTQEQVRDLHDLSETHGSDVMVNKNAAPDVEENIEVSLDSLDKKFAGDDEDEDDDDDSSSDDRRRKKWAILICLLLALLVAVAIAIAAYAIAEDDDDVRNVRGGFTPPPTPAPSRSYDICENLIAVDPLDNQLVSGDTTVALPENLDFFSKPCQFGDDKKATAAIWYQIQGDGNQWLARIMESDFEASVSIYKDEAGSTSPCKALECVAHTNDDSRRTTNWKAQEGVTYYVAVHGREGNQDDGQERSSSGTFDLALRPVVNNDFQETAFGPLELKDDDEMVDSASYRTATATGSIEWATLDDDAKVCTDNHSSSSALMPTYDVGPGVWYAVEGSGSIMKAQVTCPGGSDAEDPEEQSTTERAYRLTIYGEGEECILSYDASTCLGAEPGTLSDGSHALWQSNRDEKYYILVQGLQLGEETTPHSLGDFLLVVKDEKRAENDVCMDAIGPLATDGTRTSGTTDKATWDERDAAASGGTCVPSDGGKKGVWYTVMGTGNNMDTRLFHDQELKPEIMGMSIYSGGTCGELSCMTHDVRGGEGGELRILFPTSPEMVYHILVHSTETKEFEISIKEVMPAVNDFCETASPLYLPILGNVDVQAFGNTLNAALDKDTCRQDGSALNEGAVWYEIKNLKVGQTLTLTYSGGEILVSVLQGASCSADMTCIIAADQVSDSPWFLTQKSISWEVSEENPMFILIQQRNAAPGTLNFVLNLSVA